MSCNGKCNNAVSWEGAIPKATQGRALWAMKRLSPASQKFACDGWLLVATYINSWMVYVGPTV